MGKDRVDDDKFDITKLKRPSVTVDIIIFSIQESDLKILLIKRKIEPFKKSWALPGGFVWFDESLKEAAERELMEETGVKDVYLEQLYSFGDVNRDPRTRVITIAYYALINPDKIKLKADTDASDVAWFSLKNFPKLAFDHDRIAKYALKRLRWKIEYTTVAYSLLPEKFTLTQLQKVYEVILDRKVDKRNFRRKILSLKILKDTKEMTGDVSHRPAKLYSFKSKELENIEII
jgi:8-oxo-dGTP diphosphatase